MRTDAKTFCLVFSAVRFLESTSCAAALLPEAWQASSSLGRARVGTGWCHHLPFPCLVGLGFLLFRVLWASLAEMLTSGTFRETEYKVVFHCPELFFGSPSCIHPFPLRLCLSLSLYVKTFCDGVK